MQRAKLFAGNSNPELARAVAAYLDTPLGLATVGTFSDGEVNVEIGENVRGMDCFVIQSTCSPANSHLMELLIMIDALRRSSAKRITAVMPYYGYARQDRKVRPRVPISAKLVADLTSGRFTPAASTLIRTCLSAGDGICISASSSTSGPPGFLILIYFI